MSYTPNKEVISYYAPNIIKIDATIIPASLVHTVNVEIIKGVRDGKSLRQTGGEVMQNSQLSLTELMSFYSFLSGAQKEFFMARPNNRSLKVKCVTDTTSPGFRLEFTCFVDTRSYTAYFNSELVPSLNTLVLTQICKSHQGTPIEILTSALKAKAFIQ